MSVYTHRVDNMAEGSAGMTWVVCACKQNDLPETIIHRTCSVGGDQIEIWWVVETGSEVNCGTTTRTVSKSRHDDCRQYTFEGRVQRKNTEKTLDKKRQVDWQWSCIWALTSAVQTIWELCSGRQRQTFYKWTLFVCRDSSESVFNTDCNGMRHFSKTNGVRERWISIIKSLHLCATCQLLVQQ